IASRNTWRYRRSFGQSSDRNDMSPYLKKAAQWTTPARYRNARAKRFAARTNDGFRAKGNKRRSAAGGISVGEVMRLSRRLHHLGVEIAYRRCFAACGLARQVGHFRNARAVRTRNVRWN